MNVIIAVIGVLCWLYIIVSILQYHLGRMQFLYANGALWIARRVFNEDIVWLEYLIEEKTYEIRVVSMRDGFDVDSYYQDRICKAYKQIDRDYPELRNIQINIL